MNTSSIKMYSRDEIKTILYALDQASGEIVDHLPNQYITAYRAGYRAAISALAIAIGIPDNSSGISISLGYPRTWEIE